MYTLTGTRYTVDYDPQNLFLEVKGGNVLFRWKENAARILFYDAHTAPFAGTECVAEPFETGVRKGVRATYSGFDGSDVKVMTTVALDTTTDDLLFEVYTEGDKKREIDQLFWPSAFDFDAEKGEGYSVYPQMHGILLPAKWEKPIANYGGGRFMDRDGYMAFFGQVKNRTGYMEIFEDFWDDGYLVEHTPSVSTYLQPFHSTSLGYLSRNRIIRTSFFENCDYVTFAKHYRSYLKAKGRFVTLAQKIDKNPTVAYLQGAPVYHTGIAVHISEKSYYYRKDDPAANDRVVPFSAVGSDLEKLHDRGLGKVYLHLDGWGKRGYDNLHPDVFPPNEEAGGTEGMKALAEKADSLGYLFGIHDQYRDYYYDAPSFDLANAVENFDGSHPYCSIWYGGEQTVLCPKLAPDYVARNYNEFDKLGIPVKGAYLDVFSVVLPDECFNPRHRCTRKECGEKRNECFEILNKKGIIPSSEEVTDYALTSIALCHHAPFATVRLDNEECYGIPLVLFNLVYHECIVIPWFPTKGGWGLPRGHWGLLYALLTGGTTYVSPDDSDELLAAEKTVLKLQSRLFGQEMLSHEFLSDDYMRQRAVYTDGTVVTVDFRTDEYQIDYPEKEN